MQCCHSGTDALILSNQTHAADATVCCSQRRDQWIHAEQPTGPEADRQASHHQGDCDQQRRLPQILYLLER